MDQYSITAEEFANAFPEFGDTWGNPEWVQQNYEQLRRPSYEQYVKETYQNVLGRDPIPPEEGGTGLTFYVDQLLKGELSRDDLAVSVARGATGQDRAAANTWAETNLGAPIFDLTGAGSVVDITTGGGVTGTTAVDMTPYLGDPGKTITTMPQTTPATLQATPAGYQMQAPVIPTAGAGVAQNNLAKVPVFNVPGSQGTATAQNNMAMVPLIQPSAGSQPAPTPAPGTTPAVPTFPGYTETPEAVPTADQLRTQYGIGSVTPPVVPPAPVQGTVIPPEDQAQTPAPQPVTMFQRGGEAKKSLTREAVEKVREYMRAMDVTPLDALFAMGRTGAGAAIGLTPSGLNENEDELLARYRAMAEREQNIPQQRSDGSPPYGEDVDMQMFGSTGDRSMAEAKKGFGRSVDAIRRGVQYSPADLLGAPVDVINMALEPFGLGSEKPFMGSEYLIDKGVQAGIYEPPTGEGEETLARFAAGMVNPTLGPRAVGKVAEGIESLAKTPPKGAVTLQDAAADRQLHENPLTRSAEKPFIGELESLLIGLGKEEVTPAEVTQLVSQYKASLGSKMERRKRRVLEDRVDEIFENRDPNTPIALSQIYSDLERTSPKRFTQEILGPEYFATRVRSNIDLSENIDNPYKNEKPLGVTTLLFDAPKGVEGIGGLIYDIDKQAQGLQETYAFIGGNRQTTGLKQLQEKVMEFEQRMPSPQLSALKTEINNALDGMFELHNLTKHLNDTALARPKSNEIDAVEKSLRKDFPELFDDLRTPQLLEDPMRRNAFKSLGGREDAKYALAVGRATHAKTLKGLLNFEKELIQQGKMTDHMQGNIDKAKLALSKNGSAGIDEFDNAALFYTDDADLNNPDEGFKALRAEALYPVLKAYQTGVGNEPFRAVRNAADKFTAEATKAVPFGQSRGDYIHVMNRKGHDAQQLGFTRFVEFEPTDTILAPYSTSSGKSRLPVYDFPQSKKGAVFATELQSDMRRAAKEGNRPFETPFNLMNQEALRDLLIKNMVDVAVKRNRDLVLFPGADSAQPQLYENLHQFVEASAKDLGPNFKAVEVMTINGQGKRVVRPGIFITPEGEKEILEKGLKFAKGGMVDKPLYDRAA